MTWLMVAAGGLFGTGLGLVVGSHFATKKTLADTGWGQDMLTELESIPTWKQVKERTGTYRPRHSPKAVRRTTSVSARMKGWWAKVEASTRPRDPKEVFRGA
jgi:hypothetical protein